jgi:uncharacterized membrane protein YccC
MPESSWRSDEVLAWTEREGPARPPSAPHRWAGVALGLGLAAVFVGVMVTDTLCPEHRAWVQALALTALGAAGFAVVGLIRGWALAPLLTVATAGLGVAIGVLDAAHDAARGQLVALGFGAVGLLAAWLAFRQIPLLRWDRRVRELVTPTDAPVMVARDEQRRQEPSDDPERSTADTRRR